jgi:hypothetical protein
VCDQGEHRIVRIDEKTGAACVVAGPIVNYSDEKCCVDGPGLAARFNFPHLLCGTRPMDVRSCPIGITIAFARSHARHRDRGGRRGASPQSLFLRPIRRAR